MLTPALLDLAKCKTDRRTQEPWRRILRTKSAEVGFPIIESEGRYAVWDACQGAITPYCQVLILVQQSHRVASCRFRVRSSPIRTSFAHDARHHLTELNAEGILLNAEALVR